MTASSADAAPSPPGPDDGADSVMAARLRDELCDQYECALTAGDAPPLESLLASAPPQWRTALLADLLGVEIDHRIARHEQPMHGDYVERFPELSAAMFQAILQGRLGGADSLIGRKLHVYQCVSLIGAGAMGRVYLALHNDLHRHCALKILAPRRGAFDDDYISRFHHEGRAAAALIHPNIVTLHAVGRVDDTHFLEMEFIPGKSMRQLIRSEGPLPADRALRLITMVADGLAAAHRAGIIHRDVKPDNILVTPSGMAKIGDFGLAQQLWSSSDDHWDRLACGTPGYMAPELFRGQPATPASDVYALGLCLYELLVGRLPWQETSLTALAEQGRSQVIPDIRRVRPEISDEIATAVQLLTATLAEHRPADAIAATRLLHAVLGQERDVESLLLEAFSGDRSVSWTHEGERYLVTRRLPNGRQQRVCVEPSTAPAEERLLLISSLCCPAEGRYYERALRENAVVWHGSLAIRDVDGQAMFVVVNAYPRSTVAPEEIRRSVLQIASQADRVEQELSGDDRH